MLYYPYMSKINNTKITFSIYFALGLAIFALGVLITPFEAKAQSQNQNTGFSGYWGGYRYTYPTPNVYSTPYVTPYVTPYGTPYATPYPTPVAQPNPTNTGSNLSANSYSAVAGENQTTQNTNTPMLVKPDENYSKLTANAVFGYNSIFPSGLIQWVCFAILVLLIIIIVRKISGAEKKYLSTPLKHA